MAQSTDLQDHTAIVTGASAGIGQAAAHKLANQGADVVIAARREERLESVATEIEQTYDVDVLPVRTDVTNETEVDAMVDSCVAEFGGVDIVVNNAGTGTERDVDFEDLDTQQYRTVMDVNTDGMFFTARATLPHLRATSGTLIFVGSFAGCYPKPGSPVYAATKWWTRGLALSLAGHVGDAGVAVTVINPSGVRTEFAKDHRPEEELIRERYQPGEITEPEDVADAIVFAATEKPPNAVTELNLFRRDKLVEY
jgi:NADP-dependent 3-hydroxy acid dehydrogenase YdfG